MLQAAERLSETSATARLPTATVSATDLPDTPTPEPTVEDVPVIPIDALADLTGTDDSLGIGGLVMVNSASEIVIEDFVFLAAEAPGVDIRLGIGADFSDDVAVSLKDITGKVYEGRTLQLTIPERAFGREFDSIGVFCFATGDLFDYALFQST